MSLTKLALALSLLAAPACTGDEPVAQSVPSNQGSKPSPEQVGGYGTCTEPSCADIARACDDLIRSGCAKPFAGDGPVKPEPGTPEFADLLLGCTLVSHQQLGEARESLVGEKDEQEEERAKKGEQLPPERAELRARAVAALEAARCTRRATTCQERLDCLRGKTIAARVPHVDAGVPDAESPPIQEPSWASEWSGAGPDPLWADPPWVDAGGKAGVYLVPGVDSPSCARCAIERCASTAYLCFSASGDQQKCPGDDCCEGLRRCVARFGGYAPGAGPVEFYNALAACEIGRPHAAQQLANLQDCAKVACAGCEQKDRGATWAGDGDGGIVMEAGP